MHKLHVALAAALTTVFAVAQQPFANFESPQVRPIAVTADGSRLLVANTSDARLAVFSLSDAASPVLLREIRVGLEPVTVAPRTADEVWVVGHLSDAIAVVSLSRGVVTDTIRMPDEPADVVFVGDEAFVSVGTDREVRVVDVRTHRVKATIPIFGDEPRALVASPDGKTVWVAVHLSGNRTTVVPHEKAPPQPPPTNPKLPPAPRVGLIVDSEDPKWKAAHGVRLLDHDVVEIDVATRSVRSVYRGVGTILFNMALRPGTRELWVANTEARNLVRYEPNLRGHAVDNRVTKIVTGPSPSVTPIDLNPGIDYKTLPNPKALARALAQPTDVVWTRDGKTAWVAAFGTDRVARLDASGRVLGFVEVGPAKGSAADPRQKRGPRALAMHPSGRWLYVLNRLAASISVIDTAAGRVAVERPLSDPTPTWLKEGRGFLYDAKLSGNGTMSCASCHVDGRIDGLAWDLGNPGGEMTVARGRGGVGRFTVHPMKGPMTTQTLQSLARSEPFHWRGDRARLQDFNGAFRSLLGKTELPAADMDAFAAFMLSIVSPGNPNQNLDRTYPRTPVGGSAHDGFVFYTTQPFRAGLKCVDCHSLFSGTNGLIIPGSLLREPQPFKVPQLRNLYKRTGRKKTARGRIAGFGLLHDGSRDDVFDLLSQPVFGSLARNAAQKTMLMRFVEAFDTGTAPAVGYQVTVSATNARDPRVAAALDLLETQAAAGNVDLVVAGLLNGRRTGWLRDVVARVYRPDRSKAASASRSDLLREAAAGRAVWSFLGVPPGSGRRLGIDRDLDGVLDGDEGLEPYGSSAPACKGPIALEGNSAPAPGNRGFALVVRGAPASSTGVLIVGAARANLPVLGVTLWVAPSSAVVLDIRADVRGVAAQSAPIPPDPDLVGKSFFAQAVFRSKCGGAGFAASHGLRVTVRR